MKKMNSNEKQACRVVYVALTAYPDGGKKEKIISVACSSLKNELGTRADIESLVTAALETLKNEAIAMIIPYSELTEDQKMDDENNSGVYYKLQRDLTEEEMRELTS